MVFNGHFLGFGGGAGQQASRSKKHQVFHNANVGKEWGNKKFWKFGFVGYFCTIMYYFLIANHIQKDGFGVGGSAYILGYTPF
jgi:hypothetical protein